EYSASIIAPRDYTTDHDLRVYVDGVFLASYGTDVYRGFNTVMIVVIVGGIFVAIVALLAIFVCHFEGKKKRREESGSASPIHQLNHKPSFSYGIQQAVYSKVVAQPVMQVLSPTAIPLNDDESDMSEFSQFA
ncbi:hypothetical protein KIPB_014380, partial [Kipferlia bialata]